MSEKNISTAVAYYQAMNDKNLSTMEKYLHPEVRFIGPMGATTGKDTVLKAAKGIFSIVNHIKIRAQFGSGNQVMLTYDWDCLPPIGLFRAAVLMSFKDDLISSIELFYDARPFEQKM